MKQATWTDSDARRDQRTRTDQRSNTGRRLRGAPTSLEQQRKRFYLACMLPALVLIAVLFGVLFYETILTSLQHSTIMGESEWVGLANFSQVLTDSSFWRAAWNNYYYTVVVVGLTVVMAFVMALIVWWLPEKSWGSRFLKLAWSVPMLFMPASAALLWMFMYSSDFGLVNDIVQIFGVERRGWLGRPDTMLESVMLAEAWVWTPFVFLILHAGLANLPAEQFEAAAVDGASAWQRFRYLVLPLLKPVLVIAIALKSVMTFRTFDYVWIMTGGGPEGIADVLSTVIYSTAFTGYDHGTAAAMSLLQLPLAIPLVLFYVYSLRQESYDHGG